MTGADAAGAGGGHGLADAADAGAFLARLVRLDPAAVVRLRPVAPGGGAPAPAGPAGGRTTLWARLPWGVLVGRTVRGGGAGDVTVAAAELLTVLGQGGGTLPTRRDGQWRWPLPPAGARLVERIPGSDLRRIAAAAAGTLRSAAEQGVGGRAVGQRALRDALLDHVAVVVTPEPDLVPSGERIEISQRLIQGVVRMGFLGPVGDQGPVGVRGPVGDQGPVGEARPDEVRVRLAGRWVGLEAPYGSVWLPRNQLLDLTPIRDHPNV